MNNVNKVGYSIHHHATKVKNIGKIRSDLPKNLIIYPLTLRRLNKI